MTLINQEKNFYDLIDEHNQKLSLVQKEANLEEEYTGLYQLNDKDITKSDIANSTGIGSTRSVSSQLRCWQKTLSDKEKSYYFTFVGMEEGYDRFKDYLLSKYDDDRKVEWESIFTDEDFEIDVKNLYRLLIFKHKTKITLETGRRAFASSHTYSQVQLIKILKETRNYVYKAVWRYNRIKENYPMDKLSIKILHDSVVDAIEEHIPNFLPNKLSDPQQYLGEIASTKE